MGEVFGGDGGGKNQGGAKKKPPKGEQPRPNPTGETDKGQYLQYDNEMGAMMVDLPPQFAKYKGELEEDLMDAFYGEQAGGKQMHQTIDEWIADWMKKKIKEDPSLGKNPYEDGGDGDAF